MLKVLFFLILAVYKTKTKWLTFLASLVLNLSDTECCLHVSMLLHHLIDTPFGLLAVMLCHEIRLSRLGSSSHIKV